MKKGLILTGLLILSTFVIISCESNMNTAAPDMNERHGIHLETGKLSGSSAQMVMQIFALDQNLEEVSMEVFEDVGELEFILSEEIVNEMKEEKISIIEEADDVDEVRETIFAALPVSEYMSIQNIGSVYMEEGTDYEGCSWGCIKICMGEEDYSACMVRCCSGKDTGLVPYQDW